MSLIKNQIPILEYDTEDTALIMPGHHFDYNFGERAVMLFMERETEEFAILHKCEKVGEFKSITKTYNVYKTLCNEKALVFCQTPLGGAAAVQLMDELIAGGVRKIIAAGSCGSLIEDKEGDFFIPTAALRQEGTSYHYLPPEREVELDKDSVMAIEKTLSEAGVNYIKCKTWTTDGFYRETKEMVLYRKEEGYSVVEMECASLAACAKKRNVQFGQLLFTADSLADTDKHNIRNWGEGAFKSALSLAMKAVTEV